MADQNGRKSGITIGKDELSFFTPSHSRGVKLNKLIEDNDTQGLLLWAVFAKLNELSLLQHAQLKFMQEAQADALRRANEVTAQLDPSKLFKEVMQQFQESSQ